MITKRLSIMLGVATVGVALLAPISGSMARGGGRQQYEWVVPHWTEPESERGQWRKWQRK